MIAIIVAVIALGLNVYQTRLLQTQARANVWPYIAAGEVHKVLDAQEEYAITVDNNGVGPAVVKSVRVTLDGSPVRTWIHLFQRLGVPDAAIKNWETREINASVIPASTDRDTQVVALRVIKPELAKRLFEARKRIGIEICYCSVFDDCWIARWLTRGVRPAERCIDAGDAELQD